METKANPQASEEALLRPLLSYLDPTQCSHPGPPPSVPQGSPLLAPASTGAPRSPARPGRPAQGPPGCPRLSAWPSPCASGAHCGLPQSCGPPSRHPTRQVPPTLSGACPIQCSRLLDRPPSSPSRSPPRLPHLLPQIYEAGSSQPKKLKTKSPTALLFFLKADAPSTVLSHEHVQMSVTCRCQEAHTLDPEDSIVCRCC